MRRERKKRKFPALLNALIIYTFFGREMFVRAKQFQPNKGLFKGCGATAAIFCLPIKYHFSRICAPEQVFFCKKIKNFWVVLCLLTTSLN
jgi:hypothetical protein